LFAENSLALPNKTFPPSKLSFPTMGTRSKLIIRRRKSSKPDIHLWMHWDGYFEGVGNTLANQIALMLAKYSPEQICETIIAADANEDGEPFDSSHLMEFLEGSVQCFFNDCDDIEYEYVLDADTMTLAGSHCSGGTRKLSFANIGMGMNFDDFCSDDEEDNLTVDELIVKLQKIVKHSPTPFNKRRLEECLQQILSAYSDC
jgi:hypothetical protein